MLIKAEKAKKQLGKVIRTRRKELGFSQEGFAFECQLHRTYMGSIERGERNISLENILKIADALKIKPSKLLSLAKL
jgi:transcriptional regulator with XRE-family HTH domain